MNAVVDAQTFGSVFVTLLVGVNVALVPPRHTAADSVRAFVGAGS